MLDKYGEMSKIFDRLDDKKAKELKILSKFIAVFCREKHRGKAKEKFAVEDHRVKHILDSKNLMLCHDCSRLLNHGMAKLLLCPYDPKPVCRKCKTHCYAPDYRGRIREVMRFSGAYLVKRGRLDLLIHHLF